MGLQQSWMSCQALRGESMIERQAQVSSYKEDRLCKDVWE